MNKNLLFIVFLLSTVDAVSQNNTFTFGYGFLQADENKILEQQHWSYPGIVMHLDYERKLNSLVGVRTTIGYSDYTVLNQSLNIVNPTFEYRQYERISISVGPQFTLFSGKGFSFSSGFDIGYHFGSDETVRSDAYESSYWDYGINLLNVFYNYNGFLLGVETYVGSNMYSNVFISVGYTF
jgi:hypothetical protein